MSKIKLRIHNTDTGNLISNLRGEVGEIITTWILMRSFMIEANSLRTQNLEQDLENVRLNTLDILVDKLNDEIIARLSELAERKVGRLTFYFAQEKLQKFQDEVSNFCHFIKKNRFHKKRNYDISHKELPEKWSEHKLIHISYINVVLGVVKAQRLMKNIDSFVLGPSAKYLWREMRRRRYSLISPARLSYMMLPYLWLSPGDRQNIIKEEMEAGYDIWIDMPIKINGVERIIKTYGKMGALVLNGEIILLDESFIELNSIDVVQKKDMSGSDEA